MLVYSPLCLTQFVYYMIIGIKFWYKNNLVLFLVGKVTEPGRVPAMTCVWLALARLRVRPGGSHRACSQDLHLLFSSLLFWF